MRSEHDHMRYNTGSNRCPVMTILYNDFYYSEGKWIKNMKRFVDALIEPIYIFRFKKAIGIYRRKK